MKSVTLRDDMEYLQDIGNLYTHPGKSKEMKEPSFESTEGANESLKRLPRLVESLYGRLPGAVDNGRA